MEKLLENTKNFELFLNFLVSQAVAERKSASVRNMSMPVPGERKGVRACLRARVCVGVCVCICVYVSVLCVYVRMHVYVVRIFPGPRSCEGMKQKLT